MLSKPLAALSAGSSSSKSSSAGKSVEREQVADRVAVLGARQAPERRHVAGLRLRRGGGVELRPRGTPRRAGIARARAAGRRAASPPCAACGRSSPNARDRPRSLSTSRGLDDELGREVGRVMAIGAVAAEEVARRGRVAVRTREPPRCAEREGEQRLRDRRRNGACAPRADAFRLEDRAFARRLLRAVAWPPPRAGRIFRGNVTSGGTAAHASVDCRHGALRLQPAARGRRHAAHRCREAPGRRGRQRAARSRRGRRRRRSRRHDGAALGRAARRSRDGRASARRRRRGRPRRTASASRRSSSRPTTATREIVERLLAAGADPNARSREGQTPLMSAALNGRVGAVDALLAHGADVDAAESYRGQTALMLAAGEGNVEAMRALIAAGASVGAQSKSGFTPLLFAVRNAQLDAVRLLLEHGANVERSRARRHERAQRRDRQRVLRGRVACCSSTAPTRTCPMRARRRCTRSRGCASPAPRIAPAASASSRRRRRGRPARSRASSSRSSCSITARIPNVRVDWDEIKFEPLGGTTRNPPGLLLGRHLLTYNGATAFYVAAKNGDHEYMRLLAERRRRSHRSRIASASRR